MSLKFNIDKKDISKQKLLQDSDIKTDLITHAVKLTSSYIKANPGISSDRIVTFLSDIKKTLEEVFEEKKKQNPAVPIGESVFQDHLVCLEDGEKVKVLGPYLKKFDMSFEEYKKKWNLPDSYPSVSPSYSLFRRELALKNKLGHPNKKSKENMF
ncbi:MucR family transcriptional regulator [Candidatus Nesciobacter abundans]|nr:MucR family transcriptional regulator [Candidatus Nesciobacter abundans]